MPGDTLLQLLQHYSDKMPRYSSPNPYVQSYYANRWASVCGVPGNHGSFGTIPEPKVERIIADQPVVPYEQPKEKDIMEETPDIVYHENSVLELGNNGACQLMSAVKQDKLGEFLDKICNGRLIGAILDYTCEDSNEDWFRDCKYIIEKHAKAVADLKARANPGKRLDAALSRL